MKPDQSTDPLGRGYWRTLTDGQKRLLAALTDDYQPLRAVLSQVEANAMKVGGQVTWEKLAIIQALEVDMKNRDDVYVRRGKRWQYLWDRFGLDLTRWEVALSEVSAELDDHFAAGKL
ncbi:hypothetical protein HUE56_04500 (plasmid) [Azospirillum oryzae]|uniref:Uncharacterized protein n=1 Tax=Azospirillum oryzae TaxID=286727 RepID=A0A6N1AF26_9PROT|nr:hypothetical protein [Azospirillum oryzae]KAA0584518.1 hypothetical protein FZ938_29550 [Azospirillum oryzae]QKS49799.1 hypothetical protein HUE56_04500 [Azospirillum oryzae]